MTTVNKDDFILYKAPYADGNGFTIKFGKVIEEAELNEVEKDSGDAVRYLVQVHEEDMENTGEEALVESALIVCNLFQNPLTGPVYGKFLKERGAKVNLGGHKVTLYFPAVL